jgi:hypothetical protein
MAEAFRLGTEAGFIHTDEPEVAAYVLGSVNLALGRALGFGDAPEFERLIALAKTLYYAALGPPAERD